MQTEIDTLAQQELVIEHDTGLQQQFDHWSEGTGNAIAAAIMVLATVLVGNRQATSEPAYDAPMKPGDIAKLLGVSPHTVLGWIRTRQLTASNIATGARPKYLIQQVDLDRFLASRQPEPPVTRRRRSA